MIPIVYMDNWYSTPDYNDCYILYKDNWNDYGYHTLFSIKMKKDGELYEGEQGRKILFKDQINNFENSKKLSYEIIREYLKEGNIVDIDRLKENHQFISLSGRYEYEALKKIFKEDDEFKDILRQLNDVVYLKERESNNENLKLIDTEAFDVSLLRDQSYVKAYSESSVIMGINKEIDKQKLMFDFNFKLNDKDYYYDFNFVPNGMPHRINILIGKNGCGKSRSLIELCGAFKYKTNEEWKRPPFISNLIVFSYNINDGFISEDTSKKPPRIEYRYFGYCRKVEDDNKNKNKNICDKRIPEIGCFESFEKLYKKDKDNFEKMTKLYTEPYLIRIIEILKNSLDLRELNGFGLKYKDDGKIYTIIPNDIGHEHMQDIDFKKFEKTLYLVDNKNNILHLSSGQKTFLYLVVNILAMIKKNSLIIIDEPENTLHPNLEIDFINILYDILEKFDSFAIIATHSAIITREVPSEYVNIIRINNEGQLVMMKPTIYTFGGSVETIMNYVFDDVMVENKPFEKWLKKEVKNYKSFEEFEEKYSDKLGYRILTLCNNLWDKYAQD